MAEQKFENYFLLIEDDSSISRLICVPAVIGTVEFASECPKMNLTIWEFCV